LIAALFLMLSPAASLAGIADSPIPAPFAYHLFSVTGVINDAGTNYSTYFLCTSTSTSPQTVGVELFAAAGGGPVNNAATTALVVGPGATVGFGTAGEAFVDVSLAAGVFPKGSARILSTSKSLICTAFLKDFSNGSVGYLAVVKKTKQKGD
jgi:hypothetical protein